MHIRKSIISQPSDQVRSFLQKAGIVDTEGYVNENDPDLPKLPKKMLKQVQMLRDQEIFGDAKKTMKNAPVDGHHPFIAERIVYPKIGQRLTSADIGKEFLRVFPHLVNNASYDWCYISSSDEESIDLFKERLIDITAKEIIFSSKYSKKRSIDISWNDGYWATVEKFRERVKIIPEPKKEDQSIELSDSEMSDSDSDSDMPEEKLSRSFNILNHAFETVFLDAWFQTASKTIKDAGKHDYSYKKAESQVPQSSDNPRQVLGLPPDCSDFTIIKQAYRKLVLKCHPDKGGDPEAFKRLDAAFKELENEMQGSTFMLDDINPEAALFQARIFSRKLLEKERMPLRKEYEFLLGSWLSLHQELCKVKLDSQELMIEDDILDLRNLAKEKVQLWEFRIQFASLNVDVYSIISEEKKIKSINEIVIKLKETSKNFDLENAGKRWLNSIDCWRDANVVFFDKYVALFRSLAELYIFSKQWEKALEIRNDIINLVPERLARINLDLRAGMDVQQKRKREFFRNEPSKASRQKAHFEENTFKMNDSAQKNTSKPTPKEEKMNTESEVEIDDMQKNLMQNLAFFKLPGNIT